MSERLRNGEFYAEGAKVFRAPTWSKNDEGRNTVSIGFHACTVTEWCEPASVVDCLNASRSHAELVKALEEIASENTQWDWTDKDTAEAALGKIATQMRALARAALAKATPSRNQVERSA